MQVGDRFDTQDYNEVVAWIQANNQEVEALGHTFKITSGNTRPVGSQVETYWSVEVV